MNYEKIYADLILKRRLNEIKKLPKTDPNYIYCEKHHIVPMSCHGTNEKSNLVNLLPKEHYMAHLLLLKIYEQKHGKDHSYFKNMVYALMLLSNRRIKYKSTDTFMEFIIPAKLYEKIRNLYAALRKGIVPWNKGKKGVYSPELLALMVRNHKDMHGKNNGMYGKRGILCPTYGMKHSEKTKKLMSLNRRGIPRTEEMKRQESLARMGDGNPLRGKIYLYHPELKKKKFVTKDEVEHYRSLGYKFKVGKYKYV